MKQKWKETLHEAPKMLLHHVIWRSWSYLLFLQNQENNLTRHNPLTENELHLLNFLCKTMRANWKTQSVKSSVVTAQTPLLTADLKQPRHLFALVTPAHPKLLARVRTLLLTSLAKKYRKPQLLPSYRPCQTISALQRPPAQTQKPGLLY